MAGAGYTLYGRKNAGSLAPQIVLEEIGTPYRVTWVGRTPADVEAYRHVNPAGKIPALVLADGSALSESAAILIHLTNAHPAARMAPSPGTPAHARFLYWIVYQSANLYETVLRYYYAERYSTSGAAAAESIQAQALLDYGHHLDYLDRALSPYLLGETLSAADAYLFMLAGWYPGGLEALASRCPRLVKHAELMRRRPSTIKAEADHAED